MGNKSIIVNSQRIAESISNNKDALVDALILTETYKTACSEIEKSLDCLYNADRQIQYLEGSNLSKLCVFLPLNQPLYSLILFVVMPSFMFENTICRPPVLLREVYSKLFTILSLEKISIQLVGISRREFMQDYVSSTDAIIYTGKYDNAVEVMNNVASKTVFIFQGSAANPIVISEVAELSDDLIQKVVDTQIYNSGQDCMAPTAIFVASNLWTRFCDMLKQKLNGLVLGEYSCRSADIAPLIEENSYHSACEFLASHHERIITGGSIDKFRRIIMPTLVCFDDVMELPYASTFAPIFCLYPFVDAREIVRFLQRPECQSNKAYISVFGDLDLLLNREIVIKNDVIDSVDNGYSEFGGYGIWSGFISYNDMIVSKPILISRELAMFSKSNGIVFPVGDLDNPSFETTLVTNHLDLSGKQILEVGCGTAPHAQFLAPISLSYTAIDTNEAKVSDAVKCSIPHLQVLNMNGANLIFDSESFDYAFMFHCLHEVALNEQGAILSEIHRILVDDGVLLIIDACSNKVSDFQKCFDIVHENFADYNHILGVQHSEWVISEYIARGYFHEERNEQHKMVFNYNSMEDLASCLIRSFQYELEWKGFDKARLIKLLHEAYGDLSDGKAFEEIVSFRILRKYKNRKR
jgi:acyl-CoA reductase-like NAD-dependent aldehyde dehydrogenase/ubiquinone/menaquinone biosynthesis C-methylase UbiE